MQNRKSTIQNALPIVAAAYGEKFGVKVEVSGREAYTDGKTIVVPNVPETFKMDVLWGYLAHEASHVRFTDFSVPKLPGLHGELVNVIEDCRVERAMMALYPGTAMTLDETASYMAEQGHYRHLTLHDHPGEILRGYCLYWLQANAVGQKCLQPFQAQAKTVLDAVFPRGAVVRLEVLLRNAVTVNSTSGAAAMATQILEMIQEEAQKEQSSPPSRDQGASQGQDQGASQGQDQGASQGQDQGASQGQDQGATEDQQGGANGGKADALKRALAATQGDLRGDAKQSLKADLFAAARDGGNPDFQTVKTALPVALDVRTGAALLSEVRSATSKIRAQLVGMVQASQRTGARTRRSGKRLDVSKLHRAALGDSRLFLQRAERRRPNTAVHLLVDMSGSMNAEAGQSRRDVIARKAALALALALDAIPQVNPGVSYFCGEESTPVNAVVKHGESVQANAGRFWMRPTGSTPMAPAIWYAAFELCKCREERKLLIVITDGDPNNKVAAKNAIDICERSDIEVIGIGVGAGAAGAVAGLFSRHVFISDFDKLQSTLFNMMETSLIAV